MACKGGVRPDPIWLIERLERRVENLEKCVSRLMALHGGMGSIKAEIERHEGVSDDEKE